MVKHFVECERRTMLRATRKADAITLPILFRQIPHFRLVIPTENYRNTNRYIIFHGFQSESYQDSYEEVSRMSHNNSCIKKRPE